MLFIQFIFHLHVCMWMKRRRKKCKEKKWWKEKKHYIKIQALIRAKHGKPERIFDTKRKKQQQNATELWSVCMLESNLYVRYTAALFCERARMKLASSVFFLFAMNEMQCFFIIHWAFIANVVFISDATKKGRTRTNFFQKLHFMEKYSTRKEI